MIPYIDNIEANQLPDGGTKFEITGENGLYQLVFDKEFRMFELTTPDSWTESQPINIFAQHKKRYNAIEHGLTSWMYMCICKIQEEQREKVYGYKKKEILLENRTYIVEYCSHTQDLKLTIPGYMLVEKRRRLTKETSETTYLESGLVMQKISEIVYKELCRVDRSSFASERVSLPFECSSFNEYKIGEGTYQIGYDVNCDVVILLTRSRTIRTAVEYLEVKLPELEVLHQGELKRLIGAFINDVKSAI
jgi:hypothetical protein